MNYKQWEKKADAIIELRKHMRYVGVFALDGDLIAHAGAPGVQQDVCVAMGEYGMEKARVLSIQIRQLQAKAVAKHIKCRNVGVAKIDIAHLQFICFNQGAGNLVGMSNFNVEANDKTIREMDDACFRLSSHHYTRSDSFEAHHLLNLAATLWKDVVIIGIGLPGKVSCLSVVKDMTKSDDQFSSDTDREISRSMDEIRNMEKGKDMVTKLTDGMEKETIQNDLFSEAKDDDRKESGDKLKFTDTNNRNLGVEPKEVTRSIFDSHSRDFMFNKRPENIRRTKSVDDVIDANEASATNDYIADDRVKSATIRSIETLRNIGPFTGSVTESEDGSSELLRTKSTDALIQRKKKKPETRSRSVGGADIGTKLNRRPSRATLV